MGSETKNPQWAEAGGGRRAGGGQWGERQSLRSGPQAMVLRPSRVLASNWALFKARFSGRQRVR